jgi:murein DD-endopeptidase MepM/ murein hydrolase activator NlpD
MQKDAKYLSFLISCNSKSKIRIRRIDISKRFLQNGLLSLALVLVLSTLSYGIFGVFNFEVFDRLELASALNNPALTQISTKIPAGPRNIDYSRPDSSDDFALNSGGPFSSEQLDDEDAEMENQLRVIQTTSDPGSIPMIWAHLGKINNEFGFRRNPFGGRTYEFHNGMDINGQRGDMVVAPAGGKVTKAGWHGGYGNMIEIDHENGLFTRYGHLSRIEVAVGDPLIRGQHIGNIGSTGRSTGPHLHYELRLGERPVNPRRFLPPEPTDISRITR